MKFKIFSEEELASIFFPKSFWEKLEKWYKIPDEDLAKFKDKRAMVVYVLQVKQYQHGLINFIQEVAYHLEKGEGHFRDTANTLFASQVENYANLIGATCRENILKHCQKNYKKMNTTANEAITITDENLTSFLDHEGVTLLDFWAEFCHPCKVIGPVIDKVAGDYQGRVIVGKLNIEEHKGLTSQYKVTSIPTLIIFKNGKEFKRLIGGQTYVTICDILEKALL